MKCVVPVGRFQFEVEFANDKEFFEKTHRLNDLFGDKCCGVCGCDDLSPRIRHVSYLDEKKKTKEIDFYEMCCNNSKCRAKLSYGVSQDGGGVNLFPKRQGDDGKFDYKSRGWKKYQPERKPEPENVEEQEAGEEAAIPFKGKSKGK